MTQIPIEITYGKMPTRGSKYAAAFDVYCPRDFEVSRERFVIPLGFHIALPMWWKANIRPRSGFSLNGMAAEVRTTYRTYQGEEYVAREEVHIDADVKLGLVDCDYKDQVGVIIRVNKMDACARQRHDFDILVENHLYITAGTRIAQMEICGDDPEVELVAVKGINRDTDRGGGFGHTGVR